MTEEALRLARGRRPPGEQSTWGDRAPWPETGAREYSGGKPAVSFTWISRPELLSHLTEGSQPLVPRPPQWKPGALRQGQISQAKGAEKAFPWMARSVQDHWLQPRPV